MLPDLLAGYVCSAQSGSVRRFAGTTDQTGASMTRARTKKILIGLTSHGDLAGLRPTGYYLSEVAHPWRVFIDAGYTVDLVSTEGGQPPVDGADLSDPIQRAFTDDVEMQRKARETPRFANVDVAAYDAVLFAGGHGTMWDFPDDPDLARVVRDVYEDGGVIAAVCHGPAAFVGVTLSDGRSLVEEKQVAAFTDAEESAVGLAEVVPFLLQTRLEEIGAKHTGAPNFESHVVTDQRLVTGQNPASATGVAHAVLAALAPKVDR
ncbi:MAG: type 1 glutamine amidotransferase domain-containing protein [Geodermatophilaceae bacterium]